MPGDWNINEQGANEIAVMRKKLEIKTKVADAIFKRLLGASVEFGDSLGLYGDVLQEELKVIEVLVNECRESVDALNERLLQYETLIRKELEKAKKEAEEAASGNKGGLKNAR